MGGGSLFITVTELLSTLKKVLFADQCSSCPLTMFCCPHRTLIEMLTVKLEKYQPSRIRKKKSGFNGHRDTESELEPSTDSQHTLIERSEFTESSVVYPSLHCFQHSHYSTGIVHPHCFVLLCIIA